ncbi:MAG: hypothetical protein BWY11_01751 [Firmicutes bacterium ADurb.Bin182]|nr:MAG: hypothetical protein BWY11_01751 [Firmicutes bacterium ADurb.Bin182]
MKSKKAPSFGILTIASAYIGTVVGAGFASGQEVLQFFTVFGLAGIWGVAVSTFLFFIIGYAVLMLGRYLSAESHVPVVRFTNGRILGTAIDFIITIFLFGGLSAMIAGAGAIASEQFSVPSVFGTLVMAIITLLTVVTGKKGVVSAISLVVPFLIVSVLFIAVTSLLTNPILEREIRTAEQLKGATPNWLMSAFNYASYNIVISIGVLAPIGSETKDKKKLFFGALLGALGLGIGIIAIYLCILTNIIQVQTLEVPMIEIASKISSIVKILFALVMFAEVYTTAVGNLYAFSQRVSLKLPKTAVIGGVAFFAFLAAQLGFSNMVKYLYPAVGYGGMLFFLGIIYVFIAKRDFMK